MRRRALPDVLAAVLAAVVAAVAVVVASGCDMPSTGGLGQVGGSGNVVARQYGYTGFTKVAVDSGFTVEIVYGDAYQVGVRVDDNLVKDHLKVELDGDTLRIGLAPLWRYHDITTTARVVMPRIAGLEASGASRVTLSGFSSDEPLSLEVSGASAIETERISLGTVTLGISGASRVEGGVRLDGLAGEVSGGSRLQLAGSAKALRLDVSGGSRLDLLELTAETADLALSGGSDGQVTVTDELKAEASGGSHLKYAGDPRVSAATSGGSDVGPR